MYNKTIMDNNNQGGTPIKKPKTSISDISEQTYGNAAISIANYIIDNYSSHSSTNKCDINDFIDNFIQERLVSAQYSDLKQSLEKVHISYPQLNVERALELYSNRPQVAIGLSEECTQPHDYKEYFTEVLTQAMQQTLSSSDRQKIINQFMKTTSVSYQDKLNILNEALRNSPANESYIYDGVTP